MRPDPVNLCPVQHTLTWPLMGRIAGQVGRHGKKLCAPGSFSLVLAMVFSNLSYGQAGWLDAKR